MAGNKEIVLTTCPRDCYDSCGIAVIKRDGKIRKVVGNPDHPVARGALCGKCALGYNGVWRDPAVRLSSPLKRVGPKGEGRFEAVSWDEAIAAIAARYTTIVEESGPKAIVHAHYTGTCSRIAGGFPMRFFNRLGAREVEPDSVCNLAGHVALGYILGSSVIGFDPRTAKDARSITVWGANPSASAPHAHKHWLPEAPGTKIVIDPVRHATAEAADLHLQLFPGSDAALAFTLLHILRRDGKFDRNFIEANVLGWDEVEPLLDPCTPEWCAEITGLDAGAIEEAARIYGDGPALLWLGQGLQRQYHGGNIFRACALLPAATGNFAKPGAGLYYLNGGEMRGFDEGFIEGEELRTGPREAFSQMDLAAKLEDANDIRAFLTWNINPAASSPEQERLRAALARDDLFTVVIDLFQTDTADYADYVLPAASFLELDDLMPSYFNLNLGAVAKCQEPVGDSLPNSEIFRRLARAMSFEEEALYEADASMIARMLENSPFEGSFEDLKKVGWVDLLPEIYIPFADHKFPTASGKIEVASTAAAADGHPRVPQPSYDARPPGGRLRLLSPATKWIMNDTYANDPKIEEQIGNVSIAIHPDDAARLGIQTGAAVRLANETGALVATAEISDVIPPGAALSHKGRWPKREEQRINVNSLNSGQKSDMGDSTCVHGVEVSVGPAG